VTRVITFALFLSALPFAIAVEPALDPAQPSTATRSDSVSYDIDFRVVVTAPQNTKKLRVWVPIPPSDRGQEVKASTFATFPTDVKPTTHTEPVFGNTFAYFEFDSPQGAQIISHAFKATVWQQRWGVDVAKVTRVKRWPAGFDVYRRGESRVVVDDKFRSSRGGLRRASPAPPLS
jgi:hypothetical protein